MKGLFPPLLLSYNDLPSMVKIYFSYCAIFPKDYEMKKNELVRLWMAQGYLGLDQDKEIERVGEDYFDTLAMHSFFQDFKKDGDGNIYHMHDIVHDFAQFLVKNKCSTEEIDSGEEPSVHINISCGEARHLMLILKRPDPVNISSVQKLRSLFIEGGYRDSSMGCFSPVLFEQLTCLRALKLSNSWDDNIPSEIGKLIHLRYLDMSWLNIRELPETLCCLYNLHTLNLYNCGHLEKLPQGMGKLIKLRYLINAGTDELRYMPKGIEKLVCLRRLDKFVVGGDPDGMGMGTLECLKNLNKLRDSLRLEGLGRVVDEAEAKNAQLVKKKNLFHLELTFNDDASETSLDEGCRKDSAVLEALQPPPNLESLRIFRCRSITLSPHWMLSLTQLKSLTLGDCLKCEHLPPLGKLPRLESLVIGNMESVKRVGNEFLGVENMDTSSSSQSVIAFPKLKSLDIQPMDNWEDWEYEITGDITIMPSLSSLCISVCPKLKSLPDHLLHATSLEPLHIVGCSILEERYSVERGENYSRISSNKI
ncbi:hypothetical protein JRO89_XS09G0184600 [Xanthoceras sorbifolium]|uniref:Uncharacterized protein n=1 Tax=Xanthoceras sorbifolium TaxID=99658 RepID=A0ABQ8HLV0_9ROSI|nr:hypothetical protein JRO89_XS09G0184600 [Xanthoceras sorbifolium]